ncbi:MAG: hypothetical protein AMXMBFR37_04770 [Steroidobacteraceae bacterium]
MALFGAIAALGVFTGPRHNVVCRVMMIGGSLLVMLSTLPFAVRGVADDARGSLRLWGNSGLFAITGWFWNRRLGRFRMFATDLSRAVLLEFARRKVLVTPHDPQAFIVHARKLLAMR